MKSLEKLVCDVNRFYAVHVERLVYRMRRYKLLRKFGFEEEAQVGAVQLDFGDSGLCRSPFCKVLGLRYGKYFQRFRSKRAEQPVAMQGAGILAVMDLRIYNGYEDFRRQLCKQSGNFYRDSKKAQKNGYLFHKFQYSNHTADICEIRKSMVVRSFGPVLDAFSLSLESLGGSPETCHPNVDPECARHWEMFFGVFTMRPGYRQGSLVVNEKLVAYVRLHRIGNIVRYAEFMGHGAYLRQGIMMLLHTKLIEWLFTLDNPWAKGVYFVAYGAIEQGREGLRFWKRKALFVPKILLH